MADNVEMTLKPVEVTPDNKPTIDFSKLDDAQLSIAEKIVTEAQAQGVDPEYALSIAHIENKFNHNTSPAGALGVMQLMPNTAKALGVDPLDVDQNIKGGITYLKQQLDHYKDPYVAGMAYNAGPGVADKFLETQDPSVVPTETLDYIDNLSNLYKPKATQDEVAEVPDLATIPPSPPTEENNDLRNKVIAGATTGTIAGVANANTRQKMIEAEAEQSTPRQRAAAKLRSENADIALKEKNKASTGRLLNQQALVQDAEKKMASWDNAFSKAQDRLAAAEELARKLGIVEENVQTTPGGVTQKGGLGSGAMKHSNTMGEVHEANVVRKGTEATGSGWQQKSRLIVPEKYAATSSLSTEQLLAQKNLENAQREYRQAQIDLSKAKSAHAKESGKLANLSKQTEQGLSKAEENLNNAKEQYKNVASKKAPGMIARAGQQVGKSIFGSVIPGAAAGMDLEDARQRYNRGDIPGAVISGIGGVGGAMSMVPPIPPIGTAARLIGGLTSLVAPAVNYYRDLNATEDQQAATTAPKYAAGGAVKKFAGGGLGKVAKQAAIKLSEALGKHEAKTVAITQADRQKVGGGYLGGPGFSGLQHTDPAYGDVGAVWAVKGPGVAKTLINSAKRQPEGQTIFIPMIGSPTQHKSGQMVFDNIINDFRKSARQGNLDPDLLNIMNLRLINTVDKEGKPLFSQNFNIASRKSNNEINTFDKRAAVADVIGGIGVGGKKSQIIDYDKLIARTTDPDLIDAPTGSLGSRMFTLSGEMLERPDLHPAFPTILTGEDLAVHFKPAPREIVLNDFIKSFTEAKGREPGVMDFTRGYAPSNMITEEMLTNLQKAGYADGGLVKGYAKAGKVDLANSSKYIDGESRENNPYGYVLDDSNSRMDVSPRASLDSAVISDRGNLVHNMVSERDRLTDKYLGSTGRFASKGLEYLRTALDKAPSFTGKTLSSMGIDPNYVPIIGPMVATSRPTRQSDVVNGELKIGTDLLFGQLPETLYDYTTSGQPGFVRDGKWVPNPATGGMMYTDPYGDVNAFDFLNLAGMQVPFVKAGKAAYKAASPLLRKVMNPPVAVMEATSPGLLQNTYRMRNTGELANDPAGLALTDERAQEALGTSGLDKYNVTTGQGAWGGDSGSEFNRAYAVTLPRLGPLSKYDSQLAQFGSDTDQMMMSSIRFTPQKGSSASTAIKVNNVSEQDIINLNKKLGDNFVVQHRPKDKSAVIYNWTNKPKQMGALEDTIYSVVPNKKLTFGTYESSVIGNEGKYSKFNVKPKTPKLIDIEKRAAQRENKRKK